MEFEIFITLTIIGCFVVLGYGIALIRQNIDEIKKILNKER